jgi:hypothetical protein
VNLKSSEVPIPAWALGVAIPLPIWLRKTKKYESLRAANFSYHNLWPAVPENDYVGYNLRAIVDYHHCTIAKAF